MNLVKMIYNSIDIHLAYKIYLKLAKLYSQLSNNKEALKYLYQAWECREASVGSVHEDIADVYREIAKLHALEGNKSEALEMFKKAQDVYSELGGYEQKTKH